MLHFRENPIRKLGLHELDADTFFLRIHKQYDPAADFPLMLTPEECATLEMGTTLPRALMLPVHVDGLRAR